MTATNENPVSLDATPKLQHIPLSKIVGVHPLIERLFQELSIPPFRVFANSLLSERQLKQLLEIFPIHIVQDKKHLRCSGNIRLYQLAIQNLSPTQLIPCITESPLGNKLLQDRVVLELLFTPAVLGIRFSEIKLIAVLARKANSLGKLVSGPLVDDAYIAKLYDVDRRQLHDKATQLSVAEPTRERS